MRASRRWVLGGVFCTAVTAGGMFTALGQDGIRGVREQHEAAQRTAQALNRDAREEAREEALRQGTDAAQRNTDINTNLRSADLGLWFAPAFRQSSSTQQGLVISDVANQGAFAEAGFRPADVVTTINGQPVRTEAEFVQTLLGPSSTPGAATVVVLRNGREQALTVAPSAVMQGAVAADPLHQAGLVLAPDQSNQLVVERVFPRSPAFYAGLRAGDVITSLGGNPVTSVNAFTQALQSNSGSDLGLVVTRAGQDRQLALNLGAGTFAADGSVRTAQRTGADANQAGARGVNQNLQTNQSATLGTNAALPGTSGAVGATATAPGVNSGSLGAGTVVTPGVSGVAAGTAGAGATTGTVGTISNPAVGAITSPSATGNPTSPSLGVQPSGIRTSAPGAATSAPGLPGTTGVGTVPGSTGGAGAFTPGPSALTPGVNSGATGGVGTVAPGINSGATGGAGTVAPGINSGSTGAGSTAGGAGAVGGTGALGGAGATAGGAGAVGGTGAIGGAGASASGTGGAAAGGAGTGAGAGAGGSGAGAGGGGAGGGGT